MTQVAILMGSQSDWKVMKKAQDVLNDLGVESDCRIISAHRKPARLHEYISECEEKGVKVFIAGAGMAAHLPGVCSSITTKPIIGVPLNASLDGLDALLAIVQMPPGIPVATVGVDGAKNAGILAAQICATSDADLAQRIIDYRASQAAALNEIPKDD